MELGSEGRGRLPTQTEHVYSGNILGRVIFLREKYRLLNCILLLFDAVVLSVNRDYWILGLWLDQSKKITIIDKSHYICIWYNIYPTISCHECVSTSARYKWGLIFITWAPCMISPLRNWTVFFPCFCQNERDKILSRASALCLSQRHAALMAQHAVDGYDGRTDGWIDR